MAQIRVYHSHIEVFPYREGDQPVIEKRMSKYDKITHKYIPVCYYIENNILYLPRGANLLFLEKTFNTTPIMVTNYDNYSKIHNVEMLYEPRDNIQIDAINFLTSQKGFKKGLSYSQFGLNLDTGDGKTFCTIYAMMYYKMKSIIITHKQKIKEQWIDSILKMSNVDPSRICDIEGSETIDAILQGKIEADFYFVNHQTINSYARIHGWQEIRKFFIKIRVGIKVIDEAHKFFENSLMIDFFSNVTKSFYLTATFTRSDPVEVRLYKKAYSSLYRFGEETMNYEEKRKHIVFIVIYYQSNISINDQINIRNAHGFSSYKFIDYALNEENETILKVLRRILEQTEQLEGKTLVISPKIDSVNYIAQKMSQYTTKIISTVHSKNSEEVNKQAYDADIISSTVKSIGEGDDIKGLRVLINLEPIGSKGLADQLRGRLREYSKDDDTFMFYPVDTSIPDCYNMLKRILPVMKKKCKEIIIMKYDNL